MLLDYMTPISFPMGVLNQHNHAHSTYQIVQIEKYTYHLTISFPKQEKWRLKPILFSYFSYKYPLFVSGATFN